MKKAILAIALMGLVSAVATEATEDWSRIYLGSNPSVCGDGHAFAFEWNDHLWVADTQGGPARRLGSSQSADSWPVMSPDGTKVAFASDRDGGMKVFEFDVAKDTVRQITYHSETTWPRSWCPGGDRLLCQAFRDSSGPIDAPRRRFPLTFRRRIPR